MLPSSSNNTVALRIKSPTARHEDLLLTCARQLSVLSLKELIEAQYPAHPSPSDQKLVYAGKLLTNELMLEQFIRFEDDCSVFTIHLVCKIKDRGSVPVPSGSNDGIRHRGTGQSNAAIESANAETMTAAAQGVDSSVLELADSLSTEARELVRIQELLQSLAASPAAAATGDQELGSMQDLYGQYVQLYSQHMLRVQQLHQHHHRHHEQSDHQLRPQPAAEQEDEVNNNNDLLDRIYAVTRILLLFSVIYFHSSFFRLLFVAVVAFFVRRFQINHNNNNNNNNNNNHRDRNINDVNRGARDPNAVEGAANDVGIIGENVNQGVAENGAAEMEEDQQEEEEEEKPNLLMVAVTFVSSFLTSIIPGNNPAL